MSERISNVVRLEDRKKKLTAEKRGLKEPRYFCFNCDTDLFRNYADGRICCGNCGSLITNILIRILV
jgi:ribosomal protein S27AE